METKRYAVPLREILPDVIAKISCGGVSEQIQLEKAWQEIAGRDSGHVVFDGYRDDTLFVRVDTPARRFIWQAKRGAVLKKIQAACPAVKQVVFRISKNT